MRPIEVGDSTAILQVGDVVVYHNGSVIMCDSLIRYSDDKVECFGNVIINKDSTYVYGDRADYDGDKNIARVYSPLIKMIDGDAVLYTYNFIFNTLYNIGEYFGGGTILRGQTQLESERGYYYADTKDFVCVGKAELRDTAYQIKSDSLGYNMNTEIASFYRKTYIWNQKGEILSADKGWYYTKDEHYHFTSDAYVLTDKQEIWADDINYWSEVEDVVMRNNIQIRDEEQKVLAFGDYGIYFGETGNAMLTENPSLISFYEEEGDSLYMRADSMFMYMVDSTSIYSPDYVGNKAQAASVQEEELIDPMADIIKGKQDEMSEMIRNVEDGGTPSGLPDGGGTDVEAELDRMLGVEPDSLAMSADSLSMEAYVDGRVTAEPEAVKEVPEKVSPPAGPTQKELREQRKAEKRLAREAKKAAKAEKKRAKKGIVEEAIPESAEDVAVDGEAEDLAEAELSVDGEEDAEAEAAETDEEKEKERVMVAYRNVKLFRSDFQAVCDSLLTFSIDTTIHMHIEPVMWNSDNQIKSDLAVIYIKNEQLDKAVYTGGKDGNPIMSSELSYGNYNQVTGKVIEAYFADNELYRTDANGNGQTYYYMQDEQTGEYQGFLVVECSDITFLIVNREVEDIIYRGNPAYAIFPMDQIPADQEQQLPNFVWVGERRPSKEDVFNREILPTEREAYEAMSQPEFPLTDKINKKRNSLVKSGMWQDRTDDISDIAREFIRYVEEKYPSNN